MSRSKRHTPIVKSCGTGKWGKKQANKKLRREKYLSLKGKQYKKVYESWDINDYILYWPIEEAIKDWYDEEGEPENLQWRHERYKTLENYLLYWKKCMLNK